MRADKEFPKSFPYFHFWGFRAILCDSANNGIITMMCFDNTEVQSIHFSDFVSLNI